MGDELPSGGLNAVGRSATDGPRGRGAVDNVPGNHAWRVTMVPVCRRLVSSSGSANRRRTVRP